MMVARYFVPAWDWQDLRGHPDCVPTQDWHPCSISPEKREVTCFHMNRRRYGEITFFTRPFILSLGSSKYQQVLSHPNWLYTLTAPFLLQVRLEMCLNKPCSCVQHSRDSSHLGSLDSFLKSFVSSCDLLFPSHCLVSDFHLFVQSVQMVASLRFSDFYFKVHPLSTVFHISIDPILLIPYSDTSP